MDHNRPSLAFRLWRRLVTAVGDWQTKKRPPLCGRQEYEEVIPKLLPGDVVLHRDDRFGPCNWFIGGLMIHAGIYIGNGYIVEAVSEGVVKRPVWHILESDYTMVVRPNGRFTAEGCDYWSMPKEVFEACMKANAIEGFEYDMLFDFCDAVEFDALEKIEFNFVPKAWKEKAKQAGISFCCTEVPYFCYYPVREELGLFRRRNVSVLTKALGWIGLPTGEAVIDADMYVTAHGFDLVWCSASASLGWANYMRASEAMLYKMTAYWAGRRR